LNFHFQDLNGWLSNGTVWWDARGSGGKRHQDAHNAYGATHAAVVREALSAVVGTPDPLPVFSASNWVGDRARGWLGEEQNANWTGLKVYT
jgi:hypothetical protein